MAITIEGNTISLLTADAGQVLAAGMYGRILGAELKATTAAASARIYSGTSNAKKIAEIGDVPINGFDGVAGIDQQFKNGLFVEITGAGATLTIFLK